MSKLAGSSRHRRKEILPYATRSINFMLSNLMAIDFQDQRLRKIQQVHDELKFTEFCRFETLWPTHGPPMAHLWPIHGPRMAQAWSPNLKYFGKMTIGLWPTIYTDEIHFSIHHAYDQPSTVSRTAVFTLAEVQHSARRIHAQAPNPVGSVQSKDQAPPLALQQP